MSDSSFEPRHVMDRRGFLRTGSLGLGSLYLASSLRAAGGFARDDEKILVVLQLSGGNDGLNTVVPIDDPQYARLRGRLAIAKKDALPIGRGLGLHPALPGLAELHRDKKLAIVQGCGYPKPNRSHFKSMDIWHSADPTSSDLRYGWLGRALDQVEGAAADTAINISTKVPLALQGERYKPISFRDPNAYRYTATQSVSNAFQKLADAEEEASRNPVLAMVRRTADEALATSKRIRNLAARYKTPQGYPRQPLGSSLRSIAGLIAGGLGSRVYYTYLGGFDTHANQAGRHGNLMRQLDAGLVAFQRDLERLGVADRVCVVVFSEFGRRVKPNASGGTDHGVAGPMMVLGSAVKGGVVGEHPSLVDLNKGDLVHTTDFRRVYATLLDDWLRIDHEAPLRGKFESLDLFGRPV